MAVVDVPPHAQPDPAEGRRRVEEQGGRFLLRSFVELAWAAGDVYVEGQPWPYCPRGILKKQIARARTLGYTFKTGIEPEFFLVRRDEHGHLHLADTKDDLAKPCYDQRTLTRSLDFLTMLVTYMQELGWDPYANDHEDANGQFEIDWAYSDCLTTADRYVFLRYMVKVLAEQQGWIATFMPKPFAHLTGNGAHFHMSLWDVEKDTPLFEDPRDAFGLSGLAYHFIGGLKAHAPAVAAVTAPTVNSYKRLITGNPRSGATWAPVYISYGGNNRTQMLRLPAPGRVENRTIDGSCNPYLAATVLLAADEVIRAALGDEYAQTYIAAKRAEWEEYHNFVSQWEIDHYVDLY